ncbi:MAG TPA: class D sortase [Steroidobacteraceae bacterium]|jgi:sortase A|nr:class D sortase [Steroidobacteraceae bacterium]
MTVRVNRRWLHCLERACWIAGTALLLIYVLAAADASWGREREIARFELETPPPPDTSAWSSARVQAYHASALVANDPLIGVVAIPDVGLEVPLYSDASELNLNRGAGLIPGMARPGARGNVGIAGHRDGYFRVLRRVKVGGTIEVRTHSARYVYRVAALSIVAPTDTRLLAPTADPAVTLVTCYPFYFVGNAPQRFVVRGVLIRTEES